MEAESRADLQPEPSNARDQEAPAPKAVIGPFLFVFLIAMATWIVLSGRFDLFHLALGAISSAIVAYFSNDLILSTNIGRVPRLWYRFIRYVPWLLLEVFKANLHVLRLVFHPRMIDLIDPHIIRFHSLMGDEMALFVFANSITLTPGTITVSTSVLGNFTVHVIDKQSGKSLPGEMEARVAEIFAS